MSVIYGTITKVNNKNAESSHAVSIKAASACNEGTIFYTIEDLREKFAVGDEVILVIESKPMGVKYRGSVGMCLLLGGRHLLTISHAYDPAITWDNEYDED